MSESAPILEVENLRIRSDSGRDLVRDGSFRMDYGTTLGIVGESGSGKSLTCRAILGLLPEAVSVAGGSIRFEGVDLIGLSRGNLRAIRRDKIGAVFQDPGSYLNPSSRIGPQIAESVRVHTGCSRGESKTAALELLDDVGMNAPREVYSQFPFELSGGMLQRVLIAIALSGDPIFLIADEVTTALDVIVQDQIVKLLKKHKDTRNLSMIMVSHDLALVAQTCDRLIVMKDGAIVEQGDRAAVLSSPAHPYTQSLIANYSKFGLDL